MFTIMFPDFERRISTNVEYCLSCNAVMSSDGCSNPSCWRTRPLYPLQEILRAKAYESKNYSRTFQQLHGTR